MYVCVKFSLYILNFSVMTVNVRKKLYSCQAITHFFSNCQILAPKKLKKIYIFSRFTPSTDTAITKRHQKYHSEFFLIVYDRTELTSLNLF